jgi:hypothetical protein
VAAFAVIQTPPFESLVEDYSREHRALCVDLEWLIGRLAVSPETMGNHVPDLAGLQLPVFKTRCKDSCHSLGASGAWRIYYSIDKPNQKVFMLFIHHKREYELPRRGFLLQKLERAIDEAARD